MKDISYNSDATGVYFDIQRFSVHDGPGIRTIVFLKGCPLNCPWCSNPESQNKEPEVMFNSTFCIGCEQCAEVCPNDAIDFDLLGRIDREKCDGCEKCVEVCNTGALSMEGTKGTVKDILVELNKDRIHYRRSNGGVTLSGGEALFQSDFVVELLKGCKAQGWHTTIETAGFYPSKDLEKVVPWTDLFLYDIKIMDEQKHEEVIGQSNEQILKNAELAAESSAEMIIRTPIIPEFNDDDKIITEIAEFALEQGAKRMGILPYHSLGKDKYHGLGREYKMDEVETPSEERMEEIKELIEDVGMQCKIGGVD